MSALAIILARAGSKGVPGKNIAPVAGRPCIAWTIEHARQAAEIERVIVSTDGAEIARVARSLGADVIERPDDLAGDTATVDAAARHAVEEADRRFAARSLDPIVILYANVPVRPPGLIARAIRLVEESGADSAQSYAPVGKHHPWWTARVSKETGEIAPWEGDVLNNGVFRRQDLPPAFIPDGGALVVRRTALFLEIPGVAPGPHAFFGKDRRGLLTGEGEVVDIDSRVDLLVADAILRERGAGSRRGAPQEAAR